MIDILIGVWLASVGLLLSISRRLVHPREWSAEARAAVLLAPLTLLRAAFRRLLWAIPSTTASRSLPLLRSPTAQKDSAPPCKNG